MMKSFFLRYMVIFVGFIWVIWEASISIHCDVCSTCAIEYDGINGDRTRCILGARCRVCSRVAWDVLSRKGGGTMDFIIGIMDAKAVCCVWASIEASSGGASIDIDCLGGSGSEVVSMDVTWRRKCGMVASGWGEGTGMDVTRGWRGGSNDIAGWNKGMVDDVILIWGGWWCLVGDELVWMP